MVLNNNLSIATSFWMVLADNTSACMVAISCLMSARRMALTHRLASSAMAA